MSLNNLNAATVKSFVVIGRAAGKQHANLVALIKSLKLDEDKLDAYRDAFYLGTVAGRFALTDAKAQALLDAPAKDRTQETKRALSAAQMAWSRAKLGAGFASRAPKPRAARQPQGATVASIVAAPAAPAPIANVRDALRLATRLDKEMLAVRDGKAIALQGEAGSILRKAFSDYHDAVKRAALALGAETKPKGMPEKQAA